MRFDVRTSLDLDVCMTSGQVFRWLRTDSGRWRGVDGSDWYEIEPIACEADQVFRVTTSAQRGGFNQLFNLDMDDAAAEAVVIAAAPQMAEFVPPMRGLRMMQPRDVTEVFYCFLCTANNHLARIGPMCRKLGHYGPALHDDLTQFPRSEVIASIPEGELREKGFGYRAATIRSAAREVLARGGDDYLASLHRKSYEAAHAELLSVPNIGRKLADCICLFGLHQGEAVPIDTHLWQIATRVFFPQHEGKPLTESRYREVGDFFRDRFGSLAGWAHQRLYATNLQAQPRRKRRIR